MRSDVMMSASSPAGKGLHSCAHSLLHFCSDVLWCCERGCRYAPPSILPSHFLARCIHEQHAGCASAGRRTQASVAVSKERQPLLICSKLLSSLHLPPSFTHPSKRVQPTPTPTHTRVLSQRPLTTEQNKNMCAALVAPPHCVTHNAAPTHCVTHRPAAFHHPPYVHMNILPPLP